MKTLRWAGLAIILLGIAAGCTSKPSVPLAKRDLSTIAIQASELPKEYSDVKTRDPKEGIFNMPSLITAGLVNSVEVDLDYPQTENPTRGFSSGIFVYKDEAAAQQAYTSFVGTLANGSKLDIAAVGDETTTYESDIPMGTISLKAGMVIWRHKEALAVIFEMNEHSIDAARLETLAKAVEGRLEK
ncbi:MAG: hypothetical protein M1281_12855 [Chloroflexi bacterium]|nr:hypothetical protein [Chloroflexota bacterium]